MNEDQIELWTRYKREFRRYLLDCFIKGLCWGTVISGFVITLVGIVTYSESSFFLGLALMVLSLVVYENHRSKPPKLPI